MNKPKPDYSNRWVLLFSWLFPITYLIHIAEEYWVGEGYSAYLLRIRGVHLEPTRFWISQIVGTVLMVVGIFIARKLRFLFVMLVIIGSIVMINALTHTITAITKGGYGPGLYSSIVLWFPLGVATLIYFRNRCIRWKYWMAIGIGIAVNVVVDVFTMRGARF